MKWMDRTNPPVVDVWHLFAALRCPYVHTGWGQSFSSILSAIQRGVKRACERCENGIHVGLICIAVGASGHQEFDRTATFALEHRDALVGFDIAGSELHPEQYAPWMDKIHEAGMPITIHAAEVQYTPSHHTRQPERCCLCWCVRIV